MSRRVWSVVGLGGGVGSLGGCAALLPVGVVAALRGREDPHRGWLQGLHVVVDCAVASVQADYVVLYILITMILKVGADRPLRQCSQTNSTPVRQLDHEDGCDDRRGRDQADPRPNQVHPRY